jgi:CMP-2-keto-3-deoxyoctulosonic acid synthetase
MLRFLEHGMPVHLVESEEDSIAVDVQDDVALAEALLDADPLVLRYTD